MPSSNAIGPFTTTSGVAICVEHCTDARLNRGSSKASIAAITTGKYSGKHPAITALAANFSTVARPPRGAISPTTSSAERPDASTNARTRPTVGGTTGSPSVHPASNASACASSYGARSASIDIFITATQ